MASAGILTAMLVLSVKHLACSALTSTLDCSTVQDFRVFYDPDVEDLGSRLPPDGLERLAFAAKAGESHVVRLTRGSQLGIAQEGANINLDCLPWLSRFPGGSSVRWRFIQLDQLGNPLPGNFTNFSTLFIHVLLPRNYWRVNLKRSSTILVSYYNSILILNLHNIIIQSLLLYRQCTVNLEIFAVFQWQPQS